MRTTRTFDIIELFYACPRTLPEIFDFISFMYYPYFVCYCVDGFTILKLPVLQAAFLFNLSRQKQENAYHHISLETERRSPVVTGAERSEAERTDGIRRGQNTFNDAGIRQLSSPSGKPGKR